MEIQALNRVSVEPSLPVRKDKGDPTDAEIRKVASQFEALLIGQILQSMKGDSSGEGFGGEDQTGASMMEFAQEHLAKSIAEGGGLGLSNLIRSGLRQKSAD